MLIGLDRVNRAPGVLIFPLSLGAHFFGQNLRMQASSVRCPTTRPVLFVTLLACAVLTGTAQAQPVTPIERQCYGDVHGMLICAARVVPVDIELPPFRLVRSVHLSPTARVEAMLAQSQAKNLSRYVGDVPHYGHSNWKLIHTEFRGALETLALHEHR